MKDAERYAGAYLVRGGAAALDALITKLADDGVIERGNPDLFARSYRSFGVDDAAEIRMRARSKPIASLRRVFALSTASMTVEAQNALLKTLEEPAADALFFLVLPSPETLLPTVRSRTRALHVEAQARAGPVDADAFLAAPTAKRLEMLKPFYETEDEGRDLGSVIMFLGALEHRYSKGEDGARIAGLHAIYRARKYAGDRGSLLKTLLEQVALLAPKV